MNRNNIIIKNVSLGVFYKILNMGIVFTTIPILLNFLDKEEYGVWITIFSIVNIVFFVDAGIGNGLKTKLSEALSLKDFELSKKYISTAYVAIIILSILIFLLGIGLVQTVNLQGLFNTLIPENQLKNTLLLLLFLIVSSYILNLYKAFYYANQQAAKVELSLLIYQSIVLIGAFLLLHFFQRSLFLVAFIYGLSNVLIGIIFTILFFKNNPKLKPSLSSFKRNAVKDLIGLSLTFFVIQLCMIVIFTSDNLIISNLLGPSEVTSYDIVYKLFQVVITLSIILQDPLWALYTDAYQKKDFKWIKQTLFKLNKLFVVLIFLVLILFFISNSLIKLWTQRDLLISNELILFMALFVITRVYGTIYMYFLNSIGKIQIQMWLFIVGALINIPLSIFFVDYYQLGSSGVILGTIISILGLSIILPIQTFQILKKNEFN